MDNQKPEYVDKHYGLPPGTLIHFGKKKVDKVKITLIDYNKDFFEEKEIDSIDDCWGFKISNTTTWINISGIHEVEVVEKLGKFFELHPLVQEDILNTTQRPKMENYDKYMFIVLKMLQYHEEGNFIEYEQLSIILGKHYVITFEENVGDLFDPIRERLKHGKTRIRTFGPDYLAYALVDSIVDHYFFILEKFGERISIIEEKVLEGGNSNKTPKKLNSIRREIIFIRKSIWPVREVISNMQRTDTPLVTDNTKVYLNDVHDHTIQVIDSIENYRDIITGIMETYHSSISIRMNQIMKVLTAISTIFMPLTFIAGVYGMNFENMPELAWEWGYYIIMAIMAIIGITMFALFKRNKWF